MKVVGGGCSGLSYKMDLDQKRDELERQRQELAAALAVEGGKASGWAAQWAVLKYMLK